MEHHVITIPNLLGEEKAISDGIPAVSVTCSHVNTEHNNVNLVLKRPHKPHTTLYLSFFFLNFSIKEFVDEEKTDHRRLLSLGSLSNKMIFSSFRLEKMEK